MHSFSTSRALTFFTLFVFTSGVVVPTLPGSPDKSVSTIPLSTESQVISTSKSSSTSLSLSTLSTVSGKSLVTLSSSQSINKAQSTASTLSSASTASAASQTSKTSKTDPSSGGADPIVQGPSQDPGEPSDPFLPGSNVPGYLTLASGLVSPTQQTAQAEKAQASKTSEVEGTSSSTPSIEAPSETKPDSQVSSAPAVNTPSQPQAQKQTSNTPQAESPSQVQPASDSSGTASTPLNPVQEGTDGQPIVPATASPGEVQAKISPVLTIGSSTIAYSVNSASHLVIGSQTASPGGPAISINGVKVALASSANNIVVAGSTVPVQSPAPTSISQFIVGKEIVTANSASQYIIHGETLVPGASAITFDGTPISLAPHATQVVVGSSTIGLLRANEASLSTLTVNGQIITANGADQYIVAGQTITPGASAVTISGTPISIPPESLPTFTIDGHIITANSADKYVFDGQTITPGAPAVTISGTPISIPADLQPTRPLQGIITAGSKAYPYSLDSAGDIVLASKTLVPGGSPITVGGETISEAADGSSVVIVSGGKTKTEALGQIFTPTSSVGSFASASFTGFNSSTATRSGSAMGSTAVTPGITTAAGSLPPVNPSSPVTAGAAKAVGVLGERMGFNLLLGVLVASILCLR